MMRSSEPKHAVIVFHGQQSGAAVVPDDDLSWQGVAAQLPGMVSGAVDVVVLRELDEQSAVELYLTLQMIGAQRIRTGDQLRALLTFQPEPIHAPPVRRLFATCLQPFLAEHVGARKYEPALRSLFEIYRDCGDRPPECTARIDAVLAELTDAERADVRTYFHILLHTYGPILQSHLAQQN